MRELALRLLKVPPEPHPPAGEGLRTFRAATNFFRYKIFTWVLAQVGAIAGLVMGLVFLRIADRNLDDGVALNLIHLAEILGWITLLLEIPFTFALLRLDYELRWYIVTDRSLRIREGITKVVEKTMTFRNIQNISIRQGPLQRLLGIADLEVRTAGGGGSGPGGESKRDGFTEDMHVAYFRGVDNAAEIRDLIRERLGRQRDGGLGDPEDRARPAPPWDAATVAAARAVLVEARELRRAMAERFG